MIWKHLYKPFYAPENVTSKSLCKEKASVKMAMVDGDMISYNKSFVHVLIEKIPTVTVSNNSTTGIAKTQQ